MSRAALVVVATFAIVGAALIGYGVFELIKKVRWSGRAGRAKGVVWEITSSELEPDRYVHPKVVFRAADKRRHTFESETGTRSGLWKVGEEVDVLYDSDDPDTAFIAGSVHLYGFGVFSIVLGSVAVALAALAFFLAPSM